jgi:HD-GYP domain-containing protein (c-di-GMP phosphodiesterase class II)
MPLPGETRLTVAPDRAAEPAPARRVDDTLRQARELEGAGRIAEAITAYEAAIGLAERANECTALAEALRRVAVLWHRRDESERARDACRRSYAVARELGDDLLAAAALNTLGGLDLTTDAPERARAHFLGALALGGASGPLRARVEQNLGILANIQGELDEASTRYQCSLEAYRAAGDAHGVAVAYNNLGMVSADRGRLDDADGYFRECQRIAARSGDQYLEAGCLVNRAEIEVTRQRFENARQRAEAALDLFAHLGGHGAKADAHRVLGMLYRETGRPERAEAELRTALELADAAGSALNEAEAARELAILFQMQDRNQDALNLLNTARRLFGRVDARADLVNVGGKVAELEAIYMAVVRSWGRSLESRDHHTFGHCERVARTAVAIARALALDNHAETTILLGAYLHDLGMVRVPPETLRKRTELTSAEVDVWHMHPIWGVDLLADVEFPWDLKPIIRWHHERCDGTGYPDGLAGGAIPRGAQIVGIAAAYDALTSPRAGRPALAPDAAIAQILCWRAAWAPHIVAAFLQVAG